MVDNKSGQVTLFVILAIVIIVGVLSFFAFRDSLGFDGGEGDVLSAPVYNYVLDCVEKIAPGVIIQVSEGGGYYLGTGYSLNSGIPIYLDSSGKFIPIKSNLEEEISFFVEENLFFCVRNFVDFPNLEITQGDIRVNSEIVEGSVFLSVNYPLSIRKGEDISTLKNFGEFDFDYRLGELRDLSEALTMDYFENQGVCLNCILEASLGSDLYVSLIDEDDYLIYVLKDRGELDKGGEVLRYAFAVEKIK